jgi:hypothetical protein
MRIKARAVIPPAVKAMVNEPEDRFQIAKTSKIGIARRRAIAEMQ